MCDLSVQKIIHACLTFFERTILKPIFHSPFQNYRFRIVPDKKRSHDDEEVCLVMSRQMFTTHHVVKQQHRSNVQDSNPVIGSVMDMLPTTPMARTPTNISVVTPSSSSGNRRGTAAAFAIVKQVKYRVA